LAAPLDPIVATLTFFLDFDFDIKKSLTKDSIFVGTPRILDGAQRRSPIAIAAQRCRSSGVYLFSHVFLLGGRGAPTHALFLDFRWEWEWRKSYALAHFIRAAPKKNTK